MAGWKFVFVCLVFGVFFCFDFPALADAADGNSPAAKKDDGPGGHLEKLEVYMKQLEEIGQVWQKAGKVMFFSMSRYILL